MFDGEDDYVDLGSIDVPGEELTISAWIKPEQVTSQRNHGRIISKAKGPTDAEHWWMLSLYNRDGGPVSLRFRLKSGGKTSTLVSQEQIPLGNWVHAVARYDGSQMQIFYNGQPAGSLAKSGEISTDPNIGVRIGANPSAEYGFFNGTIDDVRLYSRALTNQEIQDLYHQGSSGI
jgi:hypothetical protein